MNTFVRSFCVEYSEYVHTVLSSCIAFLQAMLEKPQSRETVLEFYSKQGGNSITVAMIACLYVVVLL